MEGVGNIHRGLEGRLQEHQAQGLLHMVSTQELLDNLVHLEQLLEDSLVQLAGSLQERKGSLEQVDNLGRMVGNQELLVREHNLGLVGRRLEREDIQWLDKGQQVQERNLDIRELVLHNLVLN